MSLRVNSNTLVSPAPLASSSSLAASSRSANATCAANNPLYSYNSEEESHQVEDFERLFGLQGNGGAEDSQGNDTSDTLFNGEHAKMKQPALVVPSLENNSQGTTILENELQFTKELTTAAHSGGPSSDLNPPLSGTENSDHTRLDINLDWSDEKFMKLQAEAFEALQASEGGRQWLRSQGFNIPGADATDIIEPVALSQDNFPLAVTLETHGHEEEPSYAIGGWSNKSSGREQADSEGIQTLDPFSRSQIEICKYITSGHEPQFPPTFDFSRQAVPHSTESVPPLTYNPQTYTLPPFDLAVIPPPIQDSINNSFKETHHFHPEIQAFEDALKPLPQNGYVALIGDNNAYTHDEQNVGLHNTQWLYPGNDPYSCAGSFPDFTTPANLDCGPNDSLGWDIAAFPEFVEGSSKEGTLSLSNPNISMTGPSPAAKVGVDSARSIPSYVPLHINLENTIVPTPAQFFGRTLVPPVSYIPTSGTPRPNKRKSREDDRVEGQPKTKNHRSAPSADIFPCLPATIPHSSTPVSAPSEFIQGAATFSYNARTPPETPTPGFIQSRHPVPYKLENGRYKCIYTGPASKDPSKECGQTCTARDSRARNRHLATHAAKEEMLLQRGQIKREQAVALDWATRTMVKCDKPGCGFSVEVWRTDNVRRQHNLQRHPEDVLLPHPWAGAELTEWESGQLKSMCQLIHDAADRMGFKRP